jgi:hypothetical protein
MAASDKISKLTPLQAKALLREVRETIKDGLNSGSMDGEWEALVIAGEILGLELDDEEDKYA